ncbi:MAG: anthranilate synthase component I [Alphaproteobacteria bacterium]
MTDQPDSRGADGAFGAFERTYGAGRPQAVTRRIPADLETPVSAFLKLTAGRPHAQAMSVLLESVEGGAVRGRYSVIGLKPDLLFRIVDGRAEINRRIREDADAFDPMDADPLDALRAVIGETAMDLAPGTPPAAVGLFGYMGYDCVRFMERMPEPKANTLGLPDAMFFRPSITAVFDGVTGEILLTTPVWPRTDVSAREAHDRAMDRLGAAIADLAAPLPPGFLQHRPAVSVNAAEPVSNTTHEDYLAKVEAVRAYIEAGDAFQVVPSQRFSQPFPLPSFALYRSLRRLNPSPFLFHMDLGGFSLVGSSPELLVRLRDGTLTIRPIAGTRPRGAAPEEDQALADDLLSDEKERAEHLMLLDLGRNDVGRVAETGSVRVTERFSVEHYSHVMHLVSNVEGRLRADRDAVAALTAGFPAGTVSGAPKIRAMEIIHALEQDRRGPYGGLVGYFAADGSMDNCIALRTGVVKDGMLHVQAGGGVVADSNPEAEYLETVNKARALFRAAADATRFAAVLDEGTQPGPDGRRMGW